ncbi:MAG: hypothetical protein LUE90_06260 [Clostridiales bacterium]|nr:hypothetical protein [Clostridiales bacterium]
MDVQTGNVLWENSDFDASGSGVAFGEDALYLCGYYGPDFYAVSYEGKTVYRIEQFYESYYWAYQIELQDDFAVVYMEGGVDGGLDPIKIYVNLNTGEYGRNQSGETDAALILGTWYNEEYGSDWLGGQYSTEFFEDGTVVCTGMRETDNGTYEISADNTIYATFNENYYHSTETGQMSLTEGYKYTVVYTYDSDRDMLYAEYGEDFYSAGMSIGNGSGYLHR